MRRANPFEFIVSSLLAPGFHYIKNWLFSPSRCCLTKCFRSPTWIPSWYSFVISWRIMSPFRSYVLTISHFLHIFCELLHQTYFQLIASARSPLFSVFVAISVISLVFFPSSVFAVYFHRPLFQIPISSFLYT